MGPVRILVVDDDPTVSEVVARYLAREGFAVDSERDGSLALEHAIAAPPDLMVLDLMLPGMDGLDVFRRLREVAPVPTIMLTARGDESDRVLGLEIGADDYVSKPFSPRELTARVKSVLRRARGEDRPLDPSVQEVLTGGDVRVHVNQGLGWSYLPVRFLCRPRLDLITLRGGLPAGTRPRASIVGRS